ncbi:hypothetical protein HY479_01095 [Candidatus Uhrbacteria bacterium]|nr:hypothetical protein [Candidatus Uhrbacteria bacterium]
MKIDFFQQQVLEQLRERLESGDLPLRRIQEVSEHALSVSREYNGDIPNDAVLDFLKTHPEVEGQLVMVMEREDQDARDETVAEIRKLLGKNRA